MKKHILPLIAASFFYAPSSAWSNENIAEHIKELEEFAAQGDADAQAELATYYLDNKDGSNNMNKGYRLARAAAEGGSANGQRLLAICYLKGLNGEKDAALGVKWLERAAAQGMPQAICELGMLYMDGNGVERDEDKAIALFEQAAMLHSMTAANNLGIIYYTRKHDYQKAMEYFEQADALDSPLAPLYIGSMYENGLGVEQDLTNAIFWYRKAAKTQPEAQFRLGRLYANGGKGVEPIAEEAQQWFAMAASNGHLAAASYLVAQEFINAKTEDDKQSAIAKLRIIAEKGYPQAQYNLGVLYGTGNGVPKDVELGLFWLRRAAQQEYADAYASLMDYYHSMENYKEAFVWIQKLAELRHPAALYLLSIYYRQGCEVEKSDQKADELLQQAAESDYIKACDELTERCLAADKHEEAYRWATKAAELGSPVGTFILNLLYRTGNGVEKDEAKADELLAKAAEQGHRRAAFDWACTLYTQGKLQEAFQWFKKAAESGLTDAQRNIALMYRDGKGVEADPDKAFLWFHRAATQGDPQAQAHLGRLYSKGDTVEQDMKQAKLWLGKSAEQGFIPAQVMLAYLLQQEESAKGENADYTESLRWYTAAAEQGELDAMVSLVAFYMKGEQTPDNQKLAFKWATKAAEQGHAPSEAMLGHLYMQGIGVEQDLAQAENYLRKSIAHNYTAAEPILALLLIKTDDADKRAEGVSILTPIANKGDRTALDILVRMYVTDSAYDKAEELLRPLVDQKDAYATHLLIASYKQAGKEEEASQLLSEHRKEQNCQFCDSEEKNSQNEQ